MAALLDIRMPDGSRHFGELPQRVLWYALRDSVSRLAGARLTGFLCDGVTEAWIDFTFEGQRFSVNDPFGDYRFFVADAACPEDVLGVVLTHFETVGAPETSEPERRP